jgi:hypothetical protein
MTEAELQRATIECDVCGKPHGRLLSVDDRRTWRDVASWIRAACDECRVRFKRNAEKAAA